MTGWEQCLADGGHRITASRRAIIEILSRSQVPLSVQRIFEQARELHNMLGLVTVYRTMALLERMDLVRRIHREGRCDSYMLASPGHRHALVCQGCGKAVEFHGGNDLEGLLDRVEESTGYLIDEHLLQLFGLCLDCQKE